MEDFPELFFSPKTHWTQQAYIKLLLPFYINEPFWVVDVDTYIFESLPDFNSSVILALQRDADVQTNSLDKSDKQKNCSFFPSCQGCSSSYYNQGVGYYNPKEIRKLYSKDFILKEIYNLKYPYPEQCLMNKIYKGYITELSPKYNNYIYIEPIMKSPKVFHYIHGPKPWEDLNQFTKFCHEGYYYKGKRFNPRQEKR